MKLFMINYMEDDDEDSYLTIGKDDETEESVKEREIRKRDDWNCLHFLYTKEIEEVDGHKILVES